MMLPVALFAAAFLPMIVEARLSARHERALRAMGAIEPPGDVFRAMQLVYPACFAAMVAEAWLRQREPSSLVVAGAVLFVAAKTLKYWAVAALGVRWSFRVLVVPGAPMIESGPYQFLRHPNYVAVAGELASMALMAQAPAAGIASLLMFAALLRARIRVEERAWGLR